MLLVPVFIGVTVVAFGFIRVLPGDPVEVLAGERGVSAEKRVEILANLGLDKPIWQQYFSYLSDVLHGDLGVSVKTNRPVVEEFFELFPATAELALCAIIFAILIGVPAGIIAALKRGLRSIKESWEYRSLDTRCQYSGGAYYSLSYFQTP